MTDPDADELLRRLVGDRFAARFGQFPYSREHHLISCPTQVITELTSITNDAPCGTCDFTEFTARITCEHVEVTWVYGESGTLASIIKDLAEDYES